MDALGVGLIEGLDDAIMVTDASLTVLAWNGAMERLAGVARGDAVGRPATGVLGFLRDADAPAHLKQALDGQRTTIGDIPFGNGERPRWLDARYVPWRGASGEVGGVVATFADVTRRAERLRALAELEQRMHDTQAQLVQAAKMSAVGQLVSGVAHELNNPLSVVIGYGQLLLEREMPPAMKRPVELIVAQGERLSKIVRNLLYLARERPLERAAVDLRQVVEQALALRLTQLTLSKIAVVTDFQADVPLTSADAQQLEQLFLNLLLNAEQAVLDGKEQGQITLRTRLRPDGAAILAQVIDDGPGIPPESLSRVFEPFYTTRATGGASGLGLSVAYGIAQEHGGRLGVESEPGRTTFTLELPVVTPPPRPAPTAPREVSGAGKVALLVEAAVDVLDLIETLLGERGWRVDVAASGGAAVARLRERTYDLIVADMRMPEDLYRSALAERAEYGRRFIFLTGENAGERAWSFLDGTDVPVVEKPFQPRAFEAAVSRVVGAEPPA